MARYSISARGSDSLADLEALNAWLGDEPELRGMISAAEARPGPGELGAVADVLVAAVSSGGAVTVLLGSIKTFLTQPHGQHVELEVTSPDGTKVTLTADRVRSKSVPDLVELVRSARDLP